MSVLFTVESEEFKISFAHILAENFLGVSSHLKDSALDGCGLLLAPVISG